MFVGHHVVEIIFKCNYSFLHSGKHVGSIYGNIGISDPVEFFFPQTEA